MWKCASGMFIVAMFIGDQQNSYFSNLSALSLRSSSIELSSSAQLQFINNSAVNGAGIHLVDSSSIILNSGTMILFEHNTAVLGGAIYADTCTLGQTGLEDCVVKHSNPALHPDDWGVNITFIDNQLISGQANAIYVDLVQFYNFWPNSLNGTFCWKRWFYMNSTKVQKDCISELRSAPAYFNNTGPSNYLIYPGQSVRYLTQLTVHDIWGNDVTDPDKILMDIINGTAYTDQPSTISSPILPNCSSDYTNQSSLLYIHTLRFPGVAITINFQQCRQFDRSCSCYRVQNCFTVCQSPAGSSGACPSSYYNTSNQSCVQGRQGILCGNCSEGYAVAINDPDLSCTQCNYQYGVAIFLLLQLVLVLIMLTLLAVLHIKITDGHLSGFVLFSQMVTLQFPGLGYSSWVSEYSCFETTIANYYRQYVLSIPLTVYSIWNLNFLNLDPVLSVSLT